MSGVSAWLDSLEMCAVGLYRLACSEGLVESATRAMV